MRKIDLGEEGIAQFDAYGERTDDPHSETRRLVNDGETWLVLGDEDLLLLAAALEMASSGRFEALKERREADTEFSGSPLDVANTELAKRLGGLGQQMGSVASLPAGRELVEQAVAQYLPAQAESPTH